jgi:flavin-dependent dehydrogenase
LFEASKSDQITVGEHLAAEAIHELKKLKVPESILRDHSIPCTEVQNAWGSSEIHHNESVFNPFGESYILSRPDFDLALLKHCQEIGIDIHSGVRISKAEKTDNGWKLLTKSNTYDVDFLIDASGRNSKFNFDNSSIEKLTQDSLIGITKHLTNNNESISGKSHLLVESTENGWWYTVQIASGKLISTFMTDPKILTQSKMSQNEYWNEQLESSIHTKARLDSFEQTNDVFIQSAHSHIALQIQGSNWLKVGDATQSFDPLSSAGIIKGFKMGISAADSLHDFIQGDTNALRTYEEEIKNQYKEYQEKRQEYYHQEQRWISSPFWYQRILSVKQISNFSVTPLNRLTIIDSNCTEKIQFLDTQLPEINFETLFQSIKQFPLAKDAITNYLKITQQKQMNPWFLHALESLKIIGIIE